MPYIKQVRISESTSLPSANVFYSDTENNPNFSVVSKIEFSDVEVNLGLNYSTRAVVYEIDDSTDVYSVFPNKADIFVQRASRGNQDDFVTFSSPKTIQAQSGELTLVHRVTVRNIQKLDADPIPELQALVVCVPDTATAMKWSPITKAYGVPS